MRTAKPVEMITEKLYWIKSGFVGAYLYGAKDCYVCFDTGSNARLLQEAFSRLGISPKNVRTVFITHSDWDHTGGLQLLKHADVYLSEDEFQMINRRTPRLMGVTHNKPFPCPYKLLKDGETISAEGIEVTAIATPGHTPGSMSFLLNEHLLFVGDTLKLRRGRAGTFFRVMNMNTREQKASIRKLAGMQNISFVMTAHTGYCADFETAMQEWKH